MNCNEKTTLKLSPNIISKTKGDKKLGVYIPVELKQAEFRDKRLFGLLTPDQQKQLEKQLFWAQNVYDDNERFPEKLENKEQCRDCIYREICY